MTKRSNWVTTSAAHRALRTEELQRSLFAPLILGQFGWIIRPEARRDLVSIALTCQTFTEVAIDILYHDITLHHLLQVWHARGILKRVKTESELEESEEEPESAESGEEPESEESEDEHEFEESQAEPRFKESGEIVFNRVPNLSDYQHLTYYSHRVRRLDVSCQEWRANRYGTNFFPNFIEVVTGRSTEQVKLFPQLQSLNWSGAGEVELVCCEAILQASPRLKAFVYSERPEDPKSSPDSWPTLLRTLASVHSLEEIDLGWRMSLGPEGPTTRAALALSCLITKPNLKELVLPDHVVTSSVVVSSFASARQLERLSLWDPEKPVKGAAEVTPTASSHTLSYLSGTPRGMKSILSGALVFQALTTITNDDMGGDTAMTWSFVRTFVDLVGNRCPALETLVLTGYVAGGPADLRAHFVLTPLRACTRMRRFRFLAMAYYGPVAVPQDFNPTDSDWSYLISEWPNLQDMGYSFAGGYEEVGYDPSLDPKPRASINTLMEFSRSCRQLESLIVSLNATSHDTDVALQGDIVQFSSSMTFINFLAGHIEGDAVEGLAMLLLRLTRDNVKVHSGKGRNLDSLEEEGYDMSTERNWEAAKKLIDFTRKARPLGPPAAPSELSMEELIWSP